jgi:hypothetical protein
MHGEVLIFRQFQRFFLCNFAVKYSACHHNTAVAENTLDTSCRVAVIPPELNDIMQFWVSLVG